MSLLNVGSGALMANQIALQTIGNNIANANTAGYSRQSVSMGTNSGQDMGNGYVGNGVSVASIVRNYSALLNRQANTAGAVQAADLARASSLAQMQEAFSGGESGLGAAMNEMLNAFSDVVNAPTDLTARNVVLTRMTELAGRFKAASSSLDELDYTNKLQIQNDVTLVNSLAAQVAGLNTQISRSQAAGLMPNDLLDKRDQLVREMNQYVQTSQVDGADGTLNLFVGGSQALVLGANASQLSVSESLQYPGSGKLALYFTQPGNTPVELSAGMVGGGEVAGLLKFNNDDLSEGRNLLGRLAQVIGTAMNAQQTQGLTLSGAAGSPLFSQITQMPGYTAIEGVSASVSFVDTRSSANPKPVLDASAYVASDYEVVFGESGKVNLVRLSDGLTRSYDDVAQLSAQTIDGLQFNISGSGKLNETVLFKPFSSAASSMEALVLSPQDLAVSNAVTANISAGNGGSLQLAGLKVTGAGLPDAASAGVEIRFAVDPATSAVTYTASNGASGSYVPGQPIRIDGWEITLTGTPHAGDSVMVSNARSPALGDNWKRDAGNATAFLALRDAKLFDGGTTLSDGFSTLIAQVGTRTQSAKLAADLSGTIAKNLEADRTSVSGVNLDEEAAKLLQYQQAYQASAKMLQIAQSIFESMISTVGR
ncbi:flagellar hook-associated protein FlgK [Comamonas endophytica]|uniref:Flagellar hook-associated protein 1 n=1 Tax=Comamonas endophytica TaxID=2949090 RepID=A0ABY6GCW2_9BURK|nr:MULTISPECIES: flagellar hook-associated protein FlgK [unclassified Acidovorax]MCD2512717.1 flagellar hook-associated protein FlgK [Acidovorax sp. D4N7]UYG52931.1 flagellar hook-associated protein FlgK [Acidovorax sp. 5MLIR]